MTPAQETVPGTGRGTDIQCTGASLYFLPVQTRVPLKFGREVLDSVTCARVRLRVQSQDGRVAEGWGETPLSVPWAWPSELSYAERHTALKEFCIQLAKAWAEFETEGHPLTVGHAFLENDLPRLSKQFNQSDARAAEPLPLLAALVCCSAFDIALHDAFGNLVDRPVYETYGEEFLAPDLSHFLESASDKVNFAGLRPDHFLAADPPSRLNAWHLVGGLDLLGEDPRTGSEPDDEWPIVLEDWIERDKLTCLKIKLRGTDAPWDYERIVAIGNIAIERGVLWLSTDFNCTVMDPDYVNQILDRLLTDAPRIYAMILYVEQPFPYDLESHPIDVHSISARKPLFMDESAHDWRYVRLGRQLGWTGVALKTCKTQTGALLSLCWAKAHGMTLMVQDLTNPMLAQIPHFLLAAHAETIMGVETNAMQFYPAASEIEAQVHPGLYQRRHGQVDATTLTGSGFGYRIDEIDRILPAAVVEF